MTSAELEACINTYGRALFSFCLQLTADRTEAEELYQDTFVKALERLDGIDMQNNPKSYLLSIALRLWKNRKRKYAWRKRIAGMQALPQEQGYEAFLEKEESNGSNTPEECVLAAEERERVWQAVRKLPGKQKIVVLLFYMEELSVGQTAALLHIPKGTVKSRLHQARCALAKELEDLV